jgi:hypothetical protein
MNPTVTNTKSVSRTNYKSTKVRFPEASVCRTYDERVAFKKYPAVPLVVAHFEIPPGVLINARLVRG